MNDSRKIVLSLISHTNIGKTTLTRTLLKRDVGVVRDAAHVTEESQSFTLLSAGDEELVIWDTPGFGNVAKLLKRLKGEGGALGWLMHEVVDRAFNRSLYSSVEAARNVRAEADVALYLVNVQERPEDAGYIEPELELLQALGKPVVMILNQVRQQQLGDELLGRLEHDWKAHFAHYLCLKEVILLDAFTRSWHQELRLIDKVMPYLLPPKRAALSRLRDRFVANQKAVFEDCSREAADVLWYAAHQRIEAERDADPKALFRTLVSQLQTHLDVYLELLVNRHGIEAEGQARLRDDIKKVTGLAGNKVDETRSGLLAGAVSSAGSGLLADIFSGGLTFGGGALLGFLGGYLGGLSYAKALNLRKKNHIAWERETLLHLFKLLLSYYLITALHGRGKGTLELEQPVPFLAETIDAVWEARQDHVEPLIRDAVGSKSESPEPAYLKNFGALFADLVQRTLEQVYPDQKIQK